MTRQRLKKRLHSDIPMKQIVYKGCTFWLPVWAMYIARENDKRVLAFPSYPVWDEDNRELRHCLLARRDRDNTLYWYIGKDSAAILTEGIDIVHIGAYTTKRKAILTMYEGGQEIVNELSRKPIWERE